MILKLVRLIKNLLAIMLLLVLPSITTYVAAQSVRTDVYLLDKPDGQESKILVKANTLIKVLQRQNFWVEVQADKNKGWLKLNAINFVTANSSPVAIDTGRTGSGNIVATTVSRGLSAQELTQASPNFEQAKKLQTFSVSEKEAQGFLSTAGIQSPPQKIYLQAENKSTQANSVTVKSNESKTNPTPSSKTPSTPKAEDDW